jgi:hypothetical protein
MILSRARKKAAEEAKAREAAGLTATDRETKKLGESVVERETSIQSRNSYSPSECASSTSSEPNTVQGTGADVQEMKKGTERTSRNEVSMRCSSDELRSMSHYPRHPQPLQEFPYSQYPVLIPDYTALPQFPLQPWSLQTGVHCSKDCETSGRASAVRLEIMRQKLEQLQESIT